MKKLITATMFLLILTSTLVGCTASESATFTQNNGIYGTWSIRSQAFNFQPDGTGHITIEGGRGHGRGLDGTINFVWEKTDDLLQISWEDGGSDNWPFAIDGDQLIIDGNRFTRID